MSLMMCPQIANAQSYMDRFGTPPVTKPSAVPVVPKRAPIAVKPAAAQAPVEVAECTDAQATCTANADSLAALMVELQSLQARVDVLEAPPTPEGDADGPDDSGPTTTLSLSLGSAYNFRGSNYFAGKDGYGGLFAPGISVDLPNGFSIGWWSAFQITGSNRSDLILSGSGNEQDLIVGWTTDVSDRVSISVGAVAYIYPFATKAAAGATAPVWLEPGISADVDLGLTWSTYIGHNQGLQTGIAQGSYTYVSTGLSHSVPVHEKASVDLGGAAGIKGWSHGDPWRSNTVDLTADLAVSLDLDELSLSPGVHLVWTNTPPDAASDATFLWAGVDASLAY